MRLFMIFPRKNHREIIGSMTIYEIVHDFSRKNHREIIGSMTIYEIVHDFSQ